MIKKIRSSINFLNTSAKIFIRTRSFREVINRQFQDDRKVILDLDGFEYVITKDGDKFYMSKQVNTVSQVKKDYRFDDIGKNDVVIDIGASIGAFAIPASRKAQRVYAVEPMTADQLRRNVQLNKRENIEILEIALGNGAPLTIEWGGERKTVETKRLSEIIQRCPGGSFLKMDCEGGEWAVKPEELKGIRRLEMEVHQVGHPLAEMEKILELAGFEYTVEPQPEGTIGLWTIHARKK